MKRKLQKGMKAIRRAGRDSRPGNWRTSATPIGKVMAEHGVSQSAIARDLGITAQAVQGALAGRSVNYRVVAAVATACGLDVQELFDMIRTACLAKLAMQRMQ